MIDVSLNEPGATRSVPRSSKSEVQSAPSLTLAELQDLFQRAVMDGDGAILQSIPGNGRTTSDVLLGVYQYAYRGRLADILGIDHPLLKRHMGNDVFDEMAHAYITAYPSNTPNVRWFARHLPTFLKTTAPYDAHADLSELAELEQALANAFDAADEPVLSLVDLQAVPPDQWAALIFQRHASAARMTSRCNIYECWQALQDEEEPATINEPVVNQELIVWRKDEMSRVRIMTTEEAMAWDEVMRGATFGSLCEMLAVYDAPDTAPMRAAQFLQTWISAELLTTASNKARSS